LHLAFSFYTSSHINISTTFDFPLHRLKILRDSW
jgi:hypothetical protein